MPATLVLGQAFETLGQAGEAEQAYRRLLAEFPNCVPALKRLAILNAEQLGNDEVALQLGQKVRENLRDDPELNRVLGLAAYRHADYAVAAQLLGEALLVGPEDAEGLYYLGLAQLKAGDMDKGRQTLIRAMALAPDHLLSTQAQEALEKL